MSHPHLELRAHAKLNLFLEVVARRPDGYHDLETVMQAISLHDDITLRLTDQEQLTLERAGLPVDVPVEHDLCSRAARSFYSAAGTAPRVSMALMKRIPPGSGLGGGSSDAAQVLTGLNALHGHPLEPKKLLELASQIGSDVAFFLRGGRALCHGRGERVTQLEER
ncbi:MAG: 4-(cytidine 5'-diphospho)-2-C-methyl-D-erythritol kinase, partial [Planctomycetota bacterium]